MPERSSDWLRQADADRSLARSALESAHYEWAAFACQQAAEKAVKALYQRLHKEARGPVVSELLQALPDGAKPETELIDRAKSLDRHYIPTRYPNGFERGAPVDFYTAKDAREAIADAEAIVEFCRNKIG